ncbi:hypothetical protein CVT26_002145 [Gymnopilus dilepis]|uniref:N-alpha-acetyltransferase 40 n=1 Tax=Gymnopilus dilepis TaxID=231916 RepID=A0A409VBR7_9AGAR|nr:hypothetical protein CVT26_002145 [Gymnopilus dilepis]
MAPKNAVKAAKEASARRLANIISTQYDMPSMIGSIQVVHAKDLKPSQKESIWALFEENMYEFYKDSLFGWDPPTKRKELFSRLSRYILVYRNDTANLLAFTMFRFELDQGEKLLYCYELQVSKCYQNQGLGRKLLSELTKLCEAFRMEKIMLTVLKKNARASAFYKTSGFVVDPSSPSYVESDEEVDDATEDVDYDILSKSI